MGSITLSLFYDPDDDKHWSERQKYIDTKDWISKDFKSEDGNPFAICAGHLGFLWDRVPDEIPEDMRGKLPLFGGEDPDDLFMSYLFYLWKNTDEEDHLGSEELLKRLPKAKEIMARNFRIYWKYNDEQINRCMKNLDNFMNTFVEKEKLGLHPHVGIGY